MAVSGELVVLCTCDAVGKDALEGAAVEVLESEETDGPSSVSQRRSDSGLKC